MRRKEPWRGVLGWGNATVGPHFVLKHLLHSKATWNATGYASARVDELVASIETETDVAKRDAQIAEVWNTVKDDVVYLPLHHQLINWAMSDRLEMALGPQPATRFYMARLK